MTTTMAKGCHFLRAFRMSWLKLPSLFRLFATVFVSSSMLLILSSAPSRPTHVELAHYRPPNLLLRQVNTSVSKITPSTTVLNDIIAGDPVIRDKIKDRCFKPYAPTLNSTERQMLFDLVDKITSTCSTLEIECFMYGGTLLGSFRHHDVIPWDDDVDIFISHTRRGLISRELKMISEDYHVEYAGPRLKFYSIRGRTHSKYPWRWPYIDISFYNENATHIQDTAKDMKRYVYPKHIIFPAHKRPLGHIMMDSPHDAFATLKLTYKNINCQTYHYSHKYERVNTKSSHVINCADLGDVYGFVHRSASTNDSGVIETLIKAHNILHSKWVDEPKYAITKPYSLELL